MIVLQPLHDNLRQLFVFAGVIVIGLPDRCDIQPVAVLRKALQRFGYACDTRD